MYFCHHAAIPGTTVLAPSHAFMLIRWLMMFIGGFNGNQWMKSVDARLLHECIGLCLSMGYPFSNPSSDHPDIPSPSSCQCFESLHVISHLWKLHVKRISVGRSQLIIVSVCYLCTLRFYGPVAWNARIKYLNLIKHNKASQIAKVMGPTWGPPGSCRPRMGPMLAPWTLLSGIIVGMYRGWGCCMCVWWRHDMDTFSALLTPCAGKSVDSRT